MPKDLSVCLLTLCGLDFAALTAGTLRDPGEALPDQARLQ